MRKILTSLLLLSAFLVNAQQGIKKFEWKAAPKLHTIPKQFQEAAAVFVNDDRIIEYAFEKEELFFYKTLHRIVHINNDRGIEAFNKIYLPFEEGVTMIDVRARTILPNGKIIELDKSNIKDLKDEDGQYKIFALEGLTKGCEIEFYFTVKKEPSFFGREILSSGIPVMQARVELLAPDHLLFETMGFNGIETGKDTLIGEKRHTLIIVNDIKAMEEEKYSMFRASSKRVEYKLSYNAAKSTRERLFTWNELSKRLHNIYNTVNDKDIKKIRELLETINIKTASGDAEKIALIEHYVKKNFNAREDIPSDDAEDLVKVIRNKVASHRAIVKLYLGLFREAKIDYQLVLAGDRTDYMVEKNFENWNNAKNFLVYFPGTNKFLAPTETEYRYPWIPPTWAATNGLFCVSTTIGNFTTSIGEIKMIPLEKYEHNYLNMEMDLELDKKDELVIRVKQLYGGYAAPNYKMPFIFLPADEQDKVLKQMIRFGANTENIISHSFENKEMEQKDPYKPFVINASVKASNLVEHAGQKVIIKIGEVIGEQAQMYDIKSRENKIDLHYPHALVRTIRLKIPEGYRITNADDLKINVAHKENDVVTMGFVSDYEIKGNIITIRVVEDYRNYIYPRDQYPVFEKVINAAADFNKIVLVLEK
jgi:hypothetical protein